MADLAPAGWRLAEPVLRYRPLALYEKLDALRPEFRVSYYF